MRKLKHPFAIATVVLLLALLGLLLLYAYQPRYGNVQNYWSRACGVEIAGYEGRRNFHFDGVSGNLGPWHVYYEVWQHDTPHYFVRDTEVQARAADAIALLGSPIRNSRDPLCVKASDLCQMLLIEKNAKRQKCLQHLNAVQGNVEKFLEGL